MEREYFSENHVTGVEPGQKKMVFVLFVCMLNEKKNDMMYEHITNKTKFSFFNITQVPDSLLMTCL